MHLTKANTITNFIKTYHVLPQNYWYLVDIHTYIVKYLPIRRIFLFNLQELFVYSSVTSLHSNKFRDVLFRNILNTGIKD